MAKLFKKQTIKYIVQDEQKIMTMEDIEIIENKLARQNKLKHQSQPHWLLDLIIKN